MLYNAMIILFTQFFGEFEYIPIVAIIATLAIACFLVYLFCRAFGAKNISKYVFVAFIILAITLCVLYVLDIQPTFLSGVIVS